MASLIDYTVRNITTGDEEEIRVLELTGDEYAEFPAAVRASVQWLIEDSRQNPSHWNGAQQTMLDLLLPHIHDRQLYDENYAAWEHNVLDGAYDEPPEVPPAPNGGHIRLWLSGRQWRALADAVGHAADEVHASVGQSDGWGPFGLGDGSLSLDEADIALMEVCEALDDFAKAAQA